MLSCTRGIVRLVALYNNWVRNGKTETPTDQSKRTILLRHQAPRVDEPLTIRLQILLQDRVEHSCIIRE
jgi:hypothetical protein